MSDDRPYFPPPRRREPPYRAPAPRPSSETGDRSPARPVVVTRPPPPGLEPRERGPSAVAPPREETYWERHRTFANHPRSIGALLALAGAGLAWGAVDTLLHGGTYGTRGVVMAPVALLVGVWSMIAGFPLNEHGKPPEWWTVGLVSCAAIGALAGLGLLSALSD